MRNRLFKAFLVLLSVALIICSAPVGEVSYSDNSKGFAVTAQAAAKRIRLKKKKVTLKVSKSYTQKLIGKNGKNIPAKKIKWKSANKKIATVTKKGKVTAKKAGKVKITATYKGKRYSFTVTVKANSKKPVVSVTEPSTTEPTTVRNTATVTFPEGFTVVQIAERLENNSICKAADFLALANDKAFIDSLGYGFASFTAEADRAFLLEGYLFPDTYEFYLNTSAESVIKKILSNTAAKLSDDYVTVSQTLGFTLDEIITMASIIQEEAYTDESMKLISSVLHNRIKSPDYGKLQCDVTIHYVNDYILNSPYLSGDTDKYRDLYNTYKCDGLPEGPICCPGIKAIEAALYPAESNYFYFVTDKNKNYYFSETFSEHTEKWNEIQLSEQAGSQV